MPTAKIHTKQAKFTLLQLHAELGGKIKDNQAEARRLAQAMKHVEAVLKLLDPDFSLRPIAVRRRKPNPWFKRGTVLRHALDVLRKAGKPLSAREVTLAMLAAQGVTDAKPKAVRDLTGGVLSSLQNYRGKGAVARNATNPARWTVSE